MIFSETIEYFLIIYLFFFILIKRSSLGINRLARLLGLSTTRLFGKIKN